MMQAGSPQPLGATWTGQGVNFALFSAHAERVELCLFDADGAGEHLSVALPARSGDVWHGFVPAPRARVGTLYGYRVHGPWAPEAGHRFDPRKLLLDPCALEVVGEVRHDPGLLSTAPPQGWQPGDPGDTAALVPRARVIDPRVDWSGDRELRVPMKDSLLYELHVKGFTQLHPEVPPEWRGRYLGLTVPAVLAHLQSLGVTAVELLPCHAFATEPFLAQRGLRNYWGYNPLAWSAPASDYAVTDPVSEFRQMVRALHAAGIEVILDLVYNHTAEGDEDGPTLGMRGIDNSVYYLLQEDDRRHYENFTGCGNTINANHPAVVRTLIASLRHWAESMHVDGFRFDLATVLGRGRAGFDVGAPLLEALQTDPVLSTKKLIAEPWDVGHGGYQLGNFPAGWSEWNDRFRDTVRAFWRGDRRLLGSLAERFAGSGDLFRARGRKPHASVNYVASHDGFTLQDLVSYEHRHNEANLEANRDGHGDNFSWNCGIEGPTGDPEILALRERQMRNMLATVLLAHGVPMLQAGDEFGRSQGGNNNAYCQDNEISWLDWSLRERRAGLLACVRTLSGLRRTRGVLRRDAFLEGRMAGRDAYDVRWLHPEGREMTVEDWHSETQQTLGILLGGEEAVSASPETADLLVLLSAAARELAFTLPREEGAGPWRLLLDTRFDVPPPLLPTQQEYGLSAFACAVLERRARTQGPR
ncbi:MAG: glycogen debranching protein GlgX [Gammaproteobacteria bacterium]|nr:glycogen debranching protein GlgX [Gammaproteobacteria bacterium]